jgi:hypothetical protein
MDLSFQSGRNQMKYLVTLLFAVGVAGCGGASGTDIAGTVSFLEGGALPKGVVSINGPAGSYRGSISADGTYVITGVAEGDYKVTITGAMDGDPAAVNEMNYDAEGNYIKPEVVEPKSLISGIYSSSDTSGLTLKVPGEYDLRVAKAE